MNEFAPISMEGPLWVRHVRCFRLESWPDQAECDRIVDAYLQGTSPDEGMIEDPRQDELQLGV